MWSQIESHLKYEGYLHTENRNDVGDGQSYNTGNSYKRSKDLGALHDSCSWDDIWQFSADLYQKLTAAD